MLIRHSKCQKYTPTDCFFSDFARLGGTNCTTSRWMIVNIYFWGFWVISGLDSNDYVNNF